MTCSPFSLSLPWALWSNPHLKVLSGRPRSLRLTWPKSLTFFFVIKTNHPQKLYQVFSLFNPEFLTFVVSFSLKAQLLSLLCLTEFCLWPMLLMPLSRAFFCSCLPCHDLALGLSSASACFLLFFFFFDATRLSSKCGEQQATLLMEALNMIISHFSSSSPSPEFTFLTYKIFGW